MSTTALDKPEFEGLDDALAEQLPTFELFFKTVGFKRMHGRVWGLLVLAGQPLSNKEIATSLGISLAATSNCVNELAEWGAIDTSFDTARRCHLHEPVGNTLSIVATVLRRREQVIFSRFKQSATGTLDYIRKRYGEKDPRTLTLRSIISSCEIAENVMQLVIGSVATALGNPQSVLNKALNTALKIGRAPGKLLPNGKRDLEGTELDPSLLGGADDDELAPNPLAAATELEADLETPDRDEERA